MTGDNKIDNNENIIIQDWAGNILYHGDYRHKTVDKVLDANRCDCKDENRENCKTCDGTGYWGDFEVYWEDESREENIYECINY